MGIDDGGIDQAAFQLFVPCCGIRFHLLARVASSVRWTLLDSRCVGGGKLHVLRKRYEQVQRGGALNPLVLRDLPLEFGLAARAPVQAVSFSDGVGNCRKGFLDIMEGCFRRSDAFLLRRRKVVQLCQVQKELLASMLRVGDLLPRVPVISIVLLRRLRDLYTRSSKGKARGHCLHALLLKAFASRGTRFQVEPAALRWAVRGRAWGVGRHNKSQRPQPGRPKSDYAPWDVVAGLASRAHHVYRRPPIRELIAGGLLMIGFQTFIELGTWGMKREKWMGVVKGGKCQRIVWKVVIFHVLGSCRDDRQDSARKKESSWGLLRVLVGLACCCKSLPITTFFKSQFLPLYSIHGSCNRCDILHRGIVAKLSSSVWWTHDTLWAVKLCAIIAWYSGMNARYTVVVSWYVEAWRQDGGKGNTFVSGPLGEKRHKIDDRRSMLEGSERNLPPEGFVQQKGRRRRSLQGLE